MLGASANIGSINVSGSHSTGKQSAQKAIGRDDITGNLTGDKSTLSITLQEYKILDNLGFKFTHAKTDETTLREDRVISVETTTRELSQMIETLTRTYSNNTYTYWTGGTIKEASIVA